ncbi:MAG: hypothetical protein ACRDWD_17910 [Acidimicrobiia bacterium]
MSLPAFDPLGALAALLAGGVRFVVVGGFAARLWGSPSITNDLDVCYRRDPENLERLAAVLRDLGARLRGAPADVPFVLDARTLDAGGDFTFATDVGALDILATPAGTHGFDDLDRGAMEMDLGDELQVRIAALDDLIRMKRACGRTKDRIEVEVLGALREEIERGEPNPR